MNIDFLRRHWVWFLVGAIVIAIVVASVFHVAGP